MKIGSDLDGCILDAPHVIDNIFKEEYDIDITRTDIKDYSLERALPDVDNKIIRDCIDKTLASTIPQYDNAKTVLKFINDLHGKIHIISKRPSSLYVHTLDNIRILLPDYDAFELYFVANFLDKKDLVNALHLDLYIEDHPEIALDLVKHTKCTVLLMSWPWNEYIKETDRLIRVENWNDVREYILLQGDSI